MERRADTARLCLARLWLMPVGYEPPPVGVGIAPRAILRVSQPKAINLGERRGISPPWLAGICRLRMNHVASARALLMLENCSETRPVGCDGC
jgi:hypothetical protein